MSSATLAGFVRSGGDPLVSQTHGVEPISDEALLRRVAEGDQRGLVGLHRRHSSGLLAYLTRWCRDRATAEEVLQETLVAVWQGAHTFQGRSSVKAWMFGIARRQAYNRLRRKTFELVELDEDVVGSATASPIEDEVIRRADQNQVRSALDQLSDDHREAVVLFFLNELSYAEMAAVLDIPAGTVKSRLSNAKRALARKLRPDRSDWHG